MYSIDDYHLRFLTLLQANGRLANQELSERGGLSESQCSRLMCIKPPVTPIIY